jgi:hypothetical protein
MRYMNELQAAIVAAAIIHPVFAQGNPARPHYFPPYTVSSPLRQIVTALGDRVQAPGKERVTMTGSLTWQGVVSAIQIVRELPGLLRIDESGASNKSLAFDQTTTTTLTGTGAINDDDESLAETLESDTAESFLAKFGPGASVRRLGDRFKVKGETGFGSEVDIYEVVASVTFKRDKQPVTKRYMFDSNTGLLRRVVYSANQSGTTVLVQTVLSNYTAASGYALPGRIARSVNGTETFVFTLTSASITAAGAATSFTSIGGK